MSVGNSMNERMPACALNRALGMRVAPGRRAERKQAGAVAAVAPDRQHRAYDEPDAVAQRVQPSTPGMWLIMRKASLSMSSLPLSSRGQYGTPASISQRSNRA